MTQRIARERIEKERRKTRLLENEIEGGCAREREKRAERQTDRQTENRKKHN